MEPFNFIQQFYASIENDGRIGLSHISVYCALVYYCQTNACSNPFSIERKVVMKLAKISSRVTFSKCMTQLQEYGFVKYLPSHYHKVKTMIAIL